MPGPSAEPIIELQRLLEIERVPFIADGADQFSAPLRMYLVPWSAVGINRVSRYNAICRVGVTDSSGFRGWAGRVVAHDREGSFFFVCLVRIGCAYPSPAADSRPRSGGCRISCTWGRPSDWVLVVVFDGHPDQAGDDGAGLSVVLTVDGKIIPLLYGKGASRDPVERDALRSQFAAYLVKRLSDRAYRFYRVPPDPLPASETQR
jgi:hypothetical protein